MFENIPIATVLVSFVALLFSLCVHEASHAGMAYLLGDDTAARQGRLTLNPMAHADIVGTIVFPLIGLLFGGFFIGWAKPVPFDPLRLTRRFRVKVSAALISFAGPASNLVLAFLFMSICCVAIRILSPDPYGRVELLRGAFYGPESLGALGLGAGQVLILGLAGALVQLNVLLAAFNMLPVGPLDGAGVLGGILPDRLQYAYNRFRYHPYTWIGLIVLMVSGLGSYILGPVRTLTFKALLPLARLILGV